MKIIYRKIKVNYLFFKVEYLITYLKKDLVFANGQIRLSRQRPDPPAGGLA
jgi:hypothetical protein